jgi:hypothetical protein
MRRALLVAAVGVVAMVVSGCGAGGAAGGAAGGGIGAATTTATSAAEEMAVWRDFAQCARTHGLPDLPDPTMSPDGRVEFPGYQDRTPPQSVQLACKHILDRLPPDSQPSAAPTNIPALLRFAQCLRIHGFPDWPDPKANGTFPAAQLPHEKTPALISAMQACDSLNPDPGGHVYGS